MQTDSRFMEQDMLFICIPGYAVDGHDYAELAKKQGATLLITERKLDVKLPQLIVYSARKSAALLASLFYNHPADSLKLIGITGTNGKTTTANLLYQLLLIKGFKVGLIGTLGYSINGKDHESKLTTPDFIQLHEIFAQMVSEEVENVVMEVSSHSLYLDRVYGLTFQAALFTNLTQDHLDFHANMEEYALAKFKIFSLLDEVGVAVINNDDYYGNRFYREIRCKKISVGSKEADYRFSAKDNDSFTNNFQLTCNNQTFEIESQLSGDFNIYNLSLALATYYEITGSSIESSLEMVKKLLPVRGRLEAVSNDKKIGIFIDYAHTPDALDNVLSSLKQLQPKRLICVFGAGGDRDAKKRPLMMQARLNLMCKILHGKI